MSYASVFKDGPKTVTVNSASVGYSPAFTGSMGYGDSRTFPLSPGVRGTVAVSLIGEVTVSGPSGFTSAYVSASVGVPGAATRAALADVSSSMTAGSQLPNSLYGYTSVYGYSSPISLGSPALGVVATPNPLVLGIDGR